MITSVATSSREQLYEDGKERVRVFCVENKIEVPRMASIDPNRWMVGACAYYRYKEGIKICIGECASPATASQVRNWSWPGSVTDRTPYGVMCHELGHHADYMIGGKKLAYGSEYSSAVMHDSGEPPITSYAPNPCEWFAEMFRLFVTNPTLLCAVRPRTWAILTDSWVPLETGDWLDVLGPDVPSRIVKSLEKKVRW